MNTSAVSKATAVSLSQGNVQFNDTDPARGWYTGQLRNVKRGDWVQWMVQYVSTGKVLPVYTYLSGIVERVNGTALGVFVACVPPEQTGVSYGDSIPLTVDQVLEHTPADPQQSEFVMARPVVANPSEKLGAGMWNPREEVVFAGER